MRPIFLRDICTATGGRLLFSDLINDSSDSVASSVYISDVSTDTRSIEFGDLFIPIKGVNFDGHNFINEAFSKGALCTLTENDINLPFTKFAIKVPDTKKALLDIAEFYRGLFDVPVVAVTGSVGKTSTKDMIASVCSCKLSVLKTEGNFNNHIGLPLTIFKLNENHQAVVLEMGMSGFGEISSLSKVARPSVAVITNIGVAHIENLKSQNGILQAKCEVFDFIKDNGVAVLNADDYMLRSHDWRFSNDVLWYGINNNGHFYAFDICEQGLSGMNCKINTPMGVIRCFIPSPGRHMVLNALAACATGYVLGLSNDEIQFGITNFIPSSLRMDIVHSLNRTIINDCYNANPDSMKAALDVLASSNVKRAAVIGDMLELGAFEDDLHYDVGKYAALKNIDIVIAVGGKSINIYKGALDHSTAGQCVYYFEEKERLLHVLLNIIPDGYTILIKASRSMHFEEITDFILKSDRMTAIT